MVIATLMLTSLCIQEEKVVGEASTAYLTSPESAAWIREVYPEAKNYHYFQTHEEPTPYNWMIREGYEWIAHLKKLIAEKDRLADQHQVP